jgi:hypothetical protein
VKRKQEKDKVKGLKRGREGGRTFSKGREKERITRILEP